MDKVKAQANTLAQKTQETISAGQARMDTVQANRRADGMLRSLGLALLAERTGRGTERTAEEVDQLIAALTAHERETGIDLIAQAAQMAQAPQPTGPGEFLISADGPVNPVVPAVPPTQFPAPSAPFAAPPGTPPFQAAFPTQAPVPGPGPAPAPAPAADPAPGTVPDPTGFPPEVGI